MFDLNKRVDVSPLHFGAALSFAASQMAPDDYSTVASAQLTMNSSLEHASSIQRYASLSNWYCAGQEPSDCRGSMPSIHPARTSLAPVSFSVRTQLNLAMTMSVATAEKHA